MKANTNRQITNDAVQIMSQKIESLIKERTLLAEDLLCEENSFRKAQGLRESKRLSARYITLAFDKITHREE
jgi:hypothetical protein